MQAKAAWYLRAKEWRYRVRGLADRLSAVVQDFNLLRIPLKNPMFLMWGSSVSSQEEYAAERGQPDCPSSLRSSFD
ncbi:MAG: hypothetical protein ABSD89_05645 [Halobacteriota archaeon]